MPRDRPVLRKLASRAGILDRYLDQTGKEWRETSDRARVAILAALELPAETEAQAQATLSALTARARQQPLDPVRVIRQSEIGRQLDLTSGRKIRGDWSLLLRLEGGAEHVAEGATRAQPAVKPRETLPLGYHELLLTVDEKGGARQHEQRLIVVPDSCVRPSNRLSGRRVWGLTANLYSVRGEADDGIGSTAQLLTLLEFAAREGGAFVGLNPLHALRNRGHDISPYSPLSRVYRNPLYLDLRAVPEFQAVPEAQRLVNASRETDAQKVEYERTSKLHAQVIEILFAQFESRASAERRRDYLAYREREGAALTEFATFLSLEAHLVNTQGVAATGWMNWPEEYRDPASPAVKSFQAEHSREIEQHAWVQFELDRQLAAAADRARELGMPIGIYQDLAIGASAGGSDVWTHRSLFAQGVNLGAPPDPLAAEGQDWGLPPLNPHRLRDDDRYEYWRTLIRASMRYSGALRIDHVLGLFRQFWIPHGRSGKDGAYVRFPTNDLLGILALESHRANAIVVGEDLGTVPKEVPGMLEQWSVLGSRVLYFEREKEAFKRPSRYARTALTTANTHDMSPLAGYWSGRDLELRGEVGQLTPSGKKKARRERTADKALLVSVLRDEGLIDTEDPAVDDLVNAVHAFLRRTPSWLVGISLDDLTGEEEGVNLPGVPPVKYPSWTRRQGMTVEEVAQSPRVTRRLGYERRWIAGDGDS